MVHALEAGTIVAVVAGVAGWFMVLRRQTFAGHTLALIAFPGAAAAALAGLPLELGYFGSCGLGALALAGVRPGNRSLESAATGSLQALALALGYLFVDRYHGLLSGLDSLLFGTFLGVTSGQVVVLLGVAGVALALLSAACRPLLLASIAPAAPRARATPAGRPGPPLPVLPAARPPLLLASIDPAAARARGVPVRLLGLGFLLVLGLAVAATSEITGALLVFALLVMPAATAQRLTTRPALGIALSAAIALAVTWGGLVLAYSTVYPVGFYVTSLAFGLYVTVRLARRPC